jgi:hypothetical protein
MAKRDKKYYVQLFHTYLQMGLLEKVEELISLLPADTRPCSTALLCLAKEDYPAAIKQYTSLLLSHPNDLLLSSNLSITHLLTANVQTAISTLSPALEHRSPRHSTLPHAIYNLSTMYEIRDDKSRSKKERLMESVVALNGDSTLKGHYKLDSLR